MEICEEESSTLCSPKVNQATSPKNNQTLPRTRIPKKRGSHPISANLRKKE
jgi:hypothetical protein